MSIVEPELSAQRSGAAPEKTGLDQAVMDQLNSVDARTLLDTIDAIRELQVGEMVDLPQIIVVGDQSSGKSSVLEAISRVQFPVKSGVCTRFATELVLRRSALTRMSIAIKWADERSHEARSKQPQSWSNFDKSELPRLILEAGKKMGFAGSSPKDFSKDILRIEITGPDVYPLTLVDLPGFFHSETEGQTLKGKAIVNELADKYMKQKNSIILAVVSANNQLANQTVLERAKLHDETRERTLGVITKPDLAVPGEADERDCLKLLNGQDKINRLAHGWHVLRNRPQNEPSTNDRDVNEAAFFLQGPWSSVPPARKGAERLRKKLSKVLLEHIRRSLPRVVSDIVASLRGREERLRCVGERSRETTEDMRSYLLHIADKFQKLALDGIRGRYADPFFGEMYEDRRKLRAKLRNLNRAFVIILARKGTTYHVMSDKEESDQDSPKRNGVDPEFLKSILESFPDFPDPRRVSGDVFCKDLVGVASCNSGTEMPGTPNPDLVSQLFHKQAGPWPRIAGFHLQHASDVAKSFVEQLVTYVVLGDTGSASTEVMVDDRVATSILRELVDPFFEAKAEELRAKLEELLQPYTKGFGLALDDEFHRILSKRTADRAVARVEGLIDDGDNDFGTERVVDMMFTYYEISLRTFTDNVINLAVEICLIRDLPNILSTHKVTEMDEKTLWNLAQESEEAREERDRLLHETELLRQALDQCRLHRFRDAGGN